MNSEVNLVDKVALVTGGGRGLGRAFAQALAAAGTSVAITARSEDQLAETVKLIVEAGGRAISIPGDVSNPHDVDRVVSTVEEQLGPVDILVNNAGVLDPLGHTWEVSPDAWWKLFEINVRGPFLYAQAVLSSMIPRNSGRIINISSVGAHVQYADASAYCGSKAALTSLTNNLAAEIRSAGLAISIFAYAPNMVHTTLYDRLGEYFENARRNLDEGRDRPMERAVEMFMFLASGKADALSGRHISISDDASDLLNRVEEIEQKDLYTLRLSI